jgi:ferredoxin-NADP reductase
MFGLLHTHKLIFEGRDAADGDVWSLRFRPTTQLTWRAGQHVLLRLPGMARSHAGRSTDIRSRESKEMA